MALNLIRVGTLQGPVFIGVSQIVSVIPKPDGCTVKTTGGAVEVLEQASVVSELCNRRPPDGN